MNRLAKWAALVGFLWFVQALTLWVVATLDVARRGEDAIAPLWMDLWGIFGILVPVGLFLLAFIVWCVVMLVKLFRS